MRDCIWWVVVAVVLVRVRIRMSACVSMGVAVGGRVVDIYDRAIIIPRGYQHPRLSLKFTV